MELGRPIITIIGYQSWSMIMYAQVTRKPKSFSNYKSIRDALWRPVRIQVRESIWAPITNTFYTPWLHIHTP